MSEKVTLRLVPVYGYWVVYENPEDDMIWEEPVIAMGNTDEFQDEEHLNFYTLEGDGCAAPVKSEGTRNLNVTLLYRGKDVGWERTINTASSDIHGEPREVIAHRAYCYHTYLGKAGKRRKKDEETVFEEWKERSK